MVSTSTEARLAKLLARGPLQVSGRDWTELIVEKLAEVEHQLRRAGLRVQEREFDLEGSGHRTFVMRGLVVHVPGHASRKVYVQPIGLEGTAPSIRLKSITGEFLLRATRDGKWELRVPLGRGRAATSQAILDAVVTLLE